MALKSNVGLEKWGRPNQAALEMIEKSIAKILDAEARKIQKIISITCNVDEILKVNDSVNEMIKKITLLEQALCSKLEIYEKILRENSH